MSEDRPVSLADRLRAKQQGKAEPPKQSVPVFQEADALDWGGLWLGDIVEIPWPTLFDGEMEYRQCTVCSIYVSTNTADCYMTVQDKAGHRIKVTDLSLVTLIGRSV